MLREIGKSIRLAVLAIVLGLGVNYALAWTGPTATPPSGNVPAPINISSISQVKSGALGVSGLLSAYGGIDVSSQRITSLATPIAATDAVNKSYVDAAGGGGCYVSYSGGCLTGFTKKGSTGFWGYCFNGAWYYSSGNGISFFRPPGGSCSGGWYSYNLGEAFVCCM